MSQEMQILEYLEKGNEITTFEAFTLFQITRLSAKIFDLRESGHEILDEWETSENGKRFKRYYIKNQEK
jgi:hypothetical protein